MVSFRVIIIVVLQCVAQLDEPAERLYSRRRDLDPKLKCQYKMIDSSLPEKTAQPLAILG